MTEQERKFVHFIDYENVHKHVPMGEIAKGKNQQVILFVGNQQTIPNEWLRIDYNVTTIRISRTAKDNLDFHLAVYLGMIHVSRPMDVEFIVWSGDSGFDDLIEHLKTRKRRIERKDPRPRMKKIHKNIETSIKTQENKKSQHNISSQKKSSNNAVKEKEPVKKSTTSQDNLAPTIKVVGERVIQILQKTPSKVRPRKKSTLENQIETWKDGIGFTHSPSQIVNWLSQKDHITIAENERVKYNF